MDGESLVPLLVNLESKLKRKVLLMTNTRTSFSEDIPKGVARRNREAAEINEMPMWAMIRSGDYKYMTYTGEQAFEEVHDLSNDPDEMTNLALSAENRSLLGELKRKAVDALRETQSGFSTGHFRDYFGSLNTSQPAE